MFLVLDLYYTDAAQYITSTVLTRLVSPVIRTMHGSLAARDRDNGIKDC